ncbi:MAG: arylsulfatase [Mucilaginibacter sp.]
MCIRLKILFTLFFFAFVCNAQEKMQHAQPNIILIFADDLGYGDIGCYGQQKIATPNIDKLAAGGIRFTSFYAGSTVCAPSRASLLAGMHTGHTAVRGNKGYLPEGQSPLPDSIVTIVAVLQKQGYRTAAFGKWGLGYITSTGDPQKQGFDSFFGYNCQSLAHNYFPDHLWNNHERISFPENADSNAVYSADYIHAHAMKFLSQQADKPFFLFLPYTLPHGDVITPHDSIYNYYVKKFNEAPRLPGPAKTDGETHRFEPYPHAAFATMVTRLDSYTAEIMQMLRTKNMEKNTLVIFTSDNGPHRENGGDPAFFNSNGGLRGIKRDLYEGGIRVPFIAYWQGTIQTAVTSRPAALYDLYPLFSELAGVSTKRKVDGISILPALMKKKQRVHDYLYWEFHENNGRQAARWKNWKAVKLNVSKTVNTATELYDLSADPAEKNNVAAKYPAVVKKMDAIIRQAHQPNKEWPLLPAEF